MPLYKGKSRSVLARNIRTLVGEGYPQRQAVAISLYQAGIKRRARYGAPGGYGGTKKPAG